VSRISVRSHKGLACSQLLCKSDEQLSVSIIHPRDEPADSTYDRRVFARQFHGSRPRQVQFLRLAIRFEEELVEFDFECSRHFLKRFDGWHGVAILDAEM
jgi:hypothetical protein